MRFIQWRRHTKVHGQLRIRGDVHLPWVGVSPRWWWQSVVGLGLGVGLGITVFTVPSLSQATLPTLVHTSEVVPRQLLLPDTHQAWWLGQTELLALPWWERPASLQYWIGSAHLDEDSPVVVTGLANSTQLANAAEWPLGTKVVMLGSNNAWYTYQVIETKTLADDQLQNWLGTEGEAVIILTKLPSTEPNWFAIKAIRAR